MRFRGEIITLFPGMITGYLGESILGKAAQKGLVELKDALWNKIND